jgi:hypothetical protein
MAQMVKVQWRASGEASWRTGEAGMARHDVIGSRTEHSAMRHIDEA